MSYPIQDIFTRYYDDYTAAYGLDYHLDTVARSIINCKTPSLGGNMSVCSDCGHTKIHYNSCRNRHCPCCQGLVKEKWIDKRKSDVLDAPYFHMVFTVPSELNPLFIANKKLLYTLLYQASSETLSQLAKDPKHLGTNIGFISILHTWGQSLAFHPHVHCIVLGGGLTKDNKFIISKKDFLFPIRIVSKVFRGIFLEKLKLLYSSNALVFAGESLSLRNSYAFQELLTLLYKKEWIPHIKETFKGADNVIEYLGRYTHRIAISNSRILSISDDFITFRLKDYRSGKNTTMSLTPVEFIRRFFMHVLPRGFIKIRHYGLLSNRSKKVSIAICRRILRSRFRTPVFEGLSTKEILLALFDINIHTCPSCSGINFKPFRSLPKLE